MFGLLQVSRVPRPAGHRVGGRAFTLVELLVVVSIIALLIAILLPSLRRARDQAKLTKCFANLHAIYIALNCYSADNRLNLPAYKTMGEWGFRVAPGRIEPGSNGAGFPEAFGVQAVLHNGTGPVVRPNGLAQYVKTSPVYLPGDSDVWVCPGNPGPNDRPGQWKRYGNTYYYRTVNTTRNDHDEETGKPLIQTIDDPELQYDLDYLNKDSRRGSSKCLVMDNFFLWPALSGFGRPPQTSLFTITPTEIRRAPHGNRPDRKEDSGEVYCAAYADGHVGKKRWHETDK